MPLSHIAVRRKYTNFVGIIVRLRVRIDGEVVGTLGRGEERNFDVTDGKHIVQVKSGPTWMSGGPESSPVTVTVPPSVTLVICAFVASDGRFKGRRWVMALHNPSTVRTEAPLGL